MSIWLKKIIYYIIIIYLLYIFKISSAYPTRDPDIIKGEEEIKFQNKLPEDTLESQSTVIGKPLNTTKHRIGLLGNNQSILRENEKHHCPFCQYAANSKYSLENQDDNSESTQPLLIIGDIHPVDGQPNIITQEEPANDKNSTWNPQNEIKAILKIPDGNSTAQGKDFKRCTHSDGILGGGLQKTGLGNSSDLVALNNIDISCCSTLRRIVLNALQLEGKCSCSENRATSPVINITTIKDNEFEREAIRQEFPPILNRQQQTEPSQTFKNDNKKGYTSLRNDEMKIKKHNTDYSEMNTTSIQNKQANNTNLGSGRQQWTNNSDGSNITVSKVVNISLIPGKNIKGFVPNDSFDSSIDVKLGNQLAPLIANGSLITESRIYTEPSTEVKKEHVNDTTNESSNVNAPRTESSAVEVTGKNSVDFSTKSDEKLEQDSKNIFEEKYYEPTSYNNNGTLGLFVFHESDNDNLKEELNQHHKDENHIGYFNETTKEYTTDYSLSVMGSEETNSTNTVDHSLEIEMPFNDGVTESEQEPTQEMKLRPTDNDLVVSSEEEAKNDKSGKSSKIPGDLLHKKDDTKPIENESLILEQEMFLKDIKNKSFTAIIVDENKFPSTSPSEDWPDMTTMAYNLGQKLEINDTLSNEAEPEQETDNPILLKADSTIISTIVPGISIESKKTNDLYEFKDENDDFHKEDYFGKLYGTESIVQQTQTQSTYTLDREISVESTNHSPKNSTHQQSLSGQNPFGVESTVQQTPATEIVMDNKISESPADVYQPPIFRENSLSNESILQETKSSETLLENQMLNFSTEKTLNINSSDPLTNHQQYFPKEDLLGAESIVQQALPTENIFKDKISNLSIERPANLSGSMKNYQPSHPGEAQINHQEMDTLSQNEKSGKLVPDNHTLSSIQSDEVESRTLPTEWITTFVFDHLDKNIGKVATTPTFEESLLSKTVGNNTDRKQINMISTSDTITTESLSTNKTDVNEISTEGNTDIYLELEKAEDILKTIIDGLKETHLDVTHNESRATESPEMTSLDKYVTPLKNITDLKSMNTPKDDDKKIINEETFTETDENIELEQYPNNFEFNSTNDDISFNLQSQQISSKRANKDIMESITIDSNKTVIKDSSKVDMTTSSLNNMADFNENSSTKINDFDKFSADNHLLIESLEGFDSTLSPDYISQMSRGQLMVDLVRKQNSNTVVDKEHILAEQKEYTTSLFKKPSTNPTNDCKRENSVPVDDCNVLKTVIGDTVTEHYSFVDNVVIEIIDKCDNINDDSPILHEDPMQEEELLKPDSNVYLYEECLEVDSVSANPGPIEIIDQCDNIFDDSPILHKDPMQEEELLKPDSNVYSSEECLEVDSKSINPGPIEIIDQCDNTFDNSPILHEDSMQEEELLKPDSNVYSYEECLEVDSIFTNPGQIEIIDQCDNIFDDSPILCEDPMQEEELLKPDSNVYSSEECLEVDSESTNPEPISVQEQLKERSSTHSLVPYSDSSSDTDYDFPQKSKKRKKRSLVNNNEWFAVKNRKLREQGKPYLGRTQEDGKWSYNKPKEPREMKGRCQCKSKEKGSMRCATITEEDRRMIFEKFWKTFDWGEKKLYINNVVTTLPIKRARDRINVDESRRHQSLLYYLRIQDENIRVCKTMFLNTLCIGKWTVLNWKDSLRCDGIPSQLRTVKQSPVKPFEEMKKQLNAFLDALPVMESHYCRASTSKKYLLPEWSSIQALYKFYVDDWCKSHNIKALSRTVFSQGLDSRNFALFKPKKDECEKCAKYKVGTISEDEYQLHIARKIEARNEKEKDKNGKSHVLTADLQAVLMAPKSNISTLYYRTKLQVHNLCFYDLNSHHGFCFLWNETEGGVNSEEFASIWTHFLIEKYLPSIKLNDEHLEIIIYSDGCVYQNHNNILANALLFVAVTQNVTIVQKYLEVGHTQMEADSMHSLIERSLRNKKIDVPAEYVSICENARKNPCPFNVTYLEHNFLKNFNDILAYSSIRPGKRKGDSKVTDLWAIKYTPQGDIFYKLRFSDEWTIMPQRKSSLNRQQWTDLKQLHQTRLPITARKYKDLQEIKKILHADYRTYYDDLPHAD